jgi:type VI secretion system secreted protein VgrG
MADNLAARVECSDLPSEGTVVLRYQVEEALDTPYHGTVDIVIPDLEADVPMLVGADLTLVLERLPMRRNFCGVVRHVVELGRALIGGSNGVAARLYFGPALDLLNLTRDTRMFQHKSVPDILRSVLEEALGAYGREVRLELSASYPLREYCLQYQETNLAFAERLMQEEGISYGFDHAGEKEVMVLRDRNGAFPAVESLGPIELHAGKLHVRDREPVHTFVRRHGTTTTSAVLSDWDWTRSGDMDVRGEQRSQDALGRERESYEHGLGRSVSLWDYSEGVRRYQQNDVARQQGIRQEAHVRDAVVGDGMGRVIGFSAGTTFEITGNPLADLDGAYLITRVTHTSRPPRMGGEGGQNEAYHNRFECIPIATAYRPVRRGAKPNIASIQTAIVTGPGGEEIHVDEHGRIKVQFHWDRENPADETSSCWVRVQQPWAGGGWGFWWVPRIGMEVVVAFVDGDPDRPLVTGCVYNGTNALPYELPAEKTKSTIKSNSTPGGGGFNEFRFEDRAGSEEIFTHAQKDYNEVVEHDHNTLVHNDQTITVDVDQTQTIGANQTETVHGNQVMTVDGNRIVHVKSNFDETVDGTETRLVSANVTETFQSNETRTIAANVTETISASETVSIVGNQTETIVGSRTIDVGGASSKTVAGSRSTTVAGGVTMATAAAWNVTARGGANVIAAGGININAAGGMVNAAPGGITKIDSTWEWQGGFKHEFGGIKKIAVSAVSIGITWGASIDITGFKAETTGVNASITLAENKIKGGVLKAVGLKIYARAMRNKALPTVS